MNDYYKNYHYYVDHMWITINYYFKLKKISIKKRKKIKKNLMSSCWCEFDSYYCGCKKFLDFYYGVNG